jgi:hypothetical protein
MKTALIVIGVVLMVFGAIFTFVTFGFGILCAWPFILVGLILLIIGAVMSDGKTVIISQEKTKGNRYCPGCGREIAFDAGYCSYCGKKF